MNESVESSSIKQLALDIARCTEVKVALRDKSRPCHEIVTSQKPVHGSFRHVPEAWAGDLGAARILFVSSNPSISNPETPNTGEDYPLANYEDLKVPHPDWPIAPDSRLIDFQTQRLDQSRQVPYVNAAAQFLCSDGKYRGNDNASSTKASQKYWKAAFDQAERLIGPTFDLSRDVCMTEVVHCKSKQERGVYKSATFCSKRFLNRIIDNSNARLIVIGGRQARKMVHLHHKDWNLDRGHEWIIDPRFGYFKGESHQAQQHIGLFSSERFQCILIACQQLSYGSNAFRFVEQVLGNESTTKLTDVIRADIPMTFESRNDLLRKLALN